MKMLIRLISVSLLLSAFAFAQQPTQKVVVDLTTGDAKTITSHFIKGFANTLGHFQKNGSDVDTVVVIHGDAYRFFVQKLEQSPYSNDQELKKRQQEFLAGFTMLMKKYHVRFEVCSEGMKARKLDKDIFYSFVYPVPSAQISLIEWQNRGYAYLPFR
ncbi:MAG: DsrE family protein [Sulfurovaceae bacterium]|nr:DsrE family protein [Sulfurovaceae bacterium]MDD5549399.1 DsrE family protein [Sulfurovaceae bacterium]